MLKNLMPPLTLQQNPELELMIIEVDKGVLKCTAMLVDRSVPKLLLMPFARQFLSKSH